MKQPSKEALKEFIKNLKNAKTLKQQNPNAMPADIKRHKKVPLARQPVFQNGDGFTEIVSERKENVKVFDCGNSKRKMVISGKPMHFFDAQSGEYIESDNSLIDKGDCFVNAKSGYKARFAKTPHDGNFLEMEKDGHKVTLGLLSCGSACGCKKTEAVEELCYEDVLPDTDIIYEPASDRIKESIIVKAKQESYVYSFKLKTENLKASLSAKTGKISLKNAEGKEVFAIPAPYMFDANGNTSKDVKYSLKRGILTVTANPEWLNSPERVFPITIDPTVQVVADSYVNFLAYYSDGNRVDGSWLYAGECFGDTFTLTGEVNLGGILETFGLSIDSVNKCDLQLFSDFYGGGYYFEYFGLPSQEYIDVSNCDYSGDSRVYTIPLKALYEYTGSASFLMNLLDGFAEFNHFNNIIEVEYAASTPAFSSISITTPPSKTVYTEGESFNTSGMVVKAYYSNGTSQNVSGYTVSPSGALNTSNSYVTISYQGKTAKQNITVKPVLSRIAITTPPNKTVYAEGESFSSNGMVVTAYYSNGTSQIVTDYTVSPSGFLYTSNTSVTVSYQDRIATQSITVNPILLKIEITTPPTKINYIHGDTFDTRGMIVKSIFSSGTPQIIPDYKIIYSDTNYLMAGETSITISYQGKFAAQSITVAAVLVSEGYHGTRNLSFSEYGENPKFNLTTMRMLYTQPCISIGGGSYKVGVSLVYDSQMKQGLLKLCTGMSDGWKLDAHQFLIADGRDSSGKTIYKYIDGAGYIHTFEKFESEYSRYCDTDGMGLVLYEGITPEIRDDLGNKMFFKDGRLVKTVSCHDPEVVKIYQYDTSGRLEKIYDERTTKGLAAQSHIGFEYNVGNTLKNISSFLGGIMKSKLICNYTNGNLTALTKQAENGSSKTVCTFTYDGKNTLSLMVDTQKMSAVRALHQDSTANQNRTVCILSNGVINSSGAFVEKKYIYPSNGQSSDFKVSSECSIVNDKGIRLSFFLNTKGRIVSTFETDGSGKYKTLTKDAGIPMSLYSSESIAINENNAKSFTARLDLPSVLLDRPGEKVYRFYLCSFWLNHTSATGRLKASLSYTTSGSSKTSEVELDATAVGAWQQVVIPVDACGDKSVLNMLLTLTSPDNTRIDAKICNLQMIPSGKTTSKVNGLDINIIKSVSVLQKNGNKIVKKDYNLSNSKDLYLTESDVLRTLNGVYSKSTSSHEVNGFDLVLSGGSKRISHLTEITFLAPGIGSIIPDFSRNVFSIETKSPNNLSRTSQIYQYLLDQFFIKAKTESAVCTNKNKTLDTATDSEIYTSSATKEEDFYGKTLNSTDEYGVKTSYTHHRDGSLKKVVKTADGKQIVLYETVQDTSGQYTKTISDGFVSAEINYIEPYGVVDSITQNDCCKQTFIYDDFKETIMTICEYGEHDVLICKKNLEYEYGALKKVFDGHLSLTASHDLLKNKAEFSLNDNVVSDITKNTDGNKNSLRSRNYYNGNGTNTTTFTVDKHGRLTTVSENSAFTKHSYTNGKESPAAQSLTTINDIHRPEEERLTTYSYDSQNRLKSWFSKNLEVVQTSRTKTRYTFGGSENYFTDIQYDSTALQNPKIKRTQIFEENDSEIKQFNQEYKINDGRLEEKKCEITNISAEPLMFLQKYNRTYNSLDTVETHNFYSKNDMQRPTLPNYIDIKYTYGYENGLLNGVYERGKAEKDVIAGSSYYIEPYQNHETYLYDGLNRLTNETNGILGIDRTYIYGLQGRLWQTIDNKNSAKTRYFSYYKGRITRVDVGASTSSNYIEYTHDNFGNRVTKSGTFGTKSYSWFRGNLLSSATGTAYSYNYLGARFKKVSGSTTTTYYLDGSRILGEDGSNGKVRYFYDAEGLLGVKYGGEIYNYVKDAFGNVVMIIDKKGKPAATYRYDAFGNCTTTAYGDSGIAEGNPFRWKGYYFDTETCLYAIYQNGRTRYYDPEVGKFLDADYPEMLLYNCAKVGYLDRHGLGVPNPIMFHANPSNCFSGLQLYSDVQSDGKPVWQGWNILFPIISAVEIAVGAALICTGVGGVLGGILVGGGITSLVAGASNMAAGGSYIAGWAGGQINGLVSGFIGGLTMSTGWWALGGAVGNALGSFAGTGLTGIIDTVSGVKSLSTEEILRSAGINAGISFVVSLFVAGAVFRGASSQMFHESLAEISAHELAKTPRYIAASFADAAYNGFASFVAEKTGAALIDFFKQFFS